MIINKIYLAGVSLLFLLLYLTVGEVSGTTYYVSTSGSGTDCTSGSPCTMIYGVNTKSSAGDTVIFKDGTYNRTDEYSDGYLLYLTSGGSVGSVKTLQSETKYGAILDGENYDECISFTRYANYIRIENFEIKNCTSGIISADDTPASNHVYIYGNKIHHNASKGITIAHESHYWTIDSNVIFDIYTPEVNQYHGIYIANGSSNTTIINNIIYDITNGWAIHCYADPSYTQTNTKIINNTFADANPDRDGHIVVAVNTINLLIQNNIFYNPTTAAILVYPSEITGGIIRNNITSVSTNCSGDYCVDFTFTDNQTSTDPLFVNASSRNYHIKSNSPTINVGLATDAPTLDFDGNIRPQEDLFDIGAYEYAGDIEAPTVPTNVIAIGISSSQINLSWTASTDNVEVIGYKIFRNGNQIATTISVSYINTELTAFTAYNYTVLAYDASGNDSEQSSAASEVTFKAPLTSLNRLHGL